MDDAIAASLAPLLPQPTLCLGLLKWAQEHHPEKSNRYTWNDIGASYLFADRFQEQARYVPERKSWFYYDGCIWRPDIGGLITMEYCKALADALRLYAMGVEKEDYGRHVNKWQTRRYRETILKDAASVYPLSASEFDEDPLLFNCQNGTLDLRSLSFWPHRQQDLLSIVAGVNYDPDAKCPRWERFIDEITMGNTEQATYIQKILGYGLSGLTREECFFLFYGATTRNGKGTLMETYMRLQGGYGRAARPETIAAKDRANGSSPSEDIARLAGVRAVNISEPGKQLLLSASLVKTLTGNDTVNARFLHQNSFEFVPQFKLFINTNHLPKVTDATIFQSGRVKVVPFDRHFSEGEQEKDLKRTLGRPDNLSGIFNWCLRGWTMFQEEGLTVPNSVAEATTQYQRDSDKVARFVDELMEPDPEGEIKTEDAYRAYQTWCVQNGQVAGGMPTWKQEMAAYAPIKRKRPAQAGREANPVWLILGLKWKGVQPCAPF